MILSPNIKKTFKKCPYCNFEWETRELFINDPEVEIIGYLTRFRNLSKGLFYFDHSGNGTMAITVDQFADIYNGPVFIDRKTGGEGCPGHCLYKDNLVPCPNECECTYVREMIQIIKKR